MQQESAVKPTVSTILTDHPLRRVGPRAYRAHAASEWPWSLMTLGAALMSVAFVASVFSGLI